MQKKFKLHTYSTKLQIKVACTLYQISLHWLTGGSIQTALHITPWCHCEVEQLVRVTGSEGVVGVSDVTH